jgi:hypothetical protein
MNSHLRCLQSRARLCHHLFELVIDVHRPSRMRQYWRGMDVPSDQRGRLAARTNPVQHHQASIVIYVYAADDDISASNA